ncbi:MAG: nucleotidyltransferase domain-containing protein [Lachnospiraceae bacterium]|nr:nucleotidyltransferase domain-containing protein [Lachnospiraceae bacterium]
MPENIENVTKGVVNRGLELLGDKIDKIILFGSYARGDYDEESDVDIMMLLNCSENETSEYRKIVCRLSSDLSLENDVMVSLMLNDKVSFYDRMDILPFYQNVQREGVLLYG